MIQIGIHEQVHKIQIGIHEQVHIMQIMLENFRPYFIKVIKNTILFVRF